MVSTSSRETGRSAKRLMERRPRMASDARMQTKVVPVPAVDGSNGKCILTIRAELPAGPARRPGRCDAAGHRRPAAAWPDAGGNAGARVPDEPARHLAASARAEGGEARDGPCRGDSALLRAGPEGVRFAARLSRAVLDPRPERIQEASGRPNEEEAVTSSITGQENGQASGQATADVPVRKSITVKASPEDAFAVFT